MDVLLQEDELHCNVNNEYLCEAGFEIGSLGCCVECIFKHRRRCSHARQNLSSSGFGSSGFGSSGFGSSGFGSSGLGSSGGGGGL